MKRKDVLKRLGYEVPASCRVRLIVDSDAKNEADDQYAIIHHLLTPMFDVRGILAAHFENKSKNSGASMEKSYGEIQRILQLAEIEDVPILPGCRFPLRSPQDDPTSEGVEFIIREARRSDPRPLYIAVQGAMTNVAAALNRAPDIASRITVLWNGGGPYPQGRVEFNLMQDADACRAVLESPVEVWQIPQDVYASMEVSLAELAARVRPAAPWDSTSLISWWRKTSCPSILPCASAPGKTGPWGTMPPLPCCWKTSFPAIGTSAPPPASALTSPTRKIPTAK